MFQRIIAFSIKNKVIIAFMVATLIGAGIYALQRLPLDAVPDITNNQVQVVTVSPTLAPQEIEQYITFPLEVAMKNIPRVQEIRSISRYGLSVVTIVFDDAVPVLEARQLVKEQIDVAAGMIPAGQGSPEMMPITTGLGEIYQYVLTVKPGYERRYDAMALRTIQDWLVKRQLAGTPGIIEVSSFGGLVKEYEVAVDPARLLAVGVTINEVTEALGRNNRNSGGSYIEHGPNALYIRTEGVVKTSDDIARIVVANRDGVPVLVRDVAEVRLGSPQRYGAMTMDGKGEVVGGITLMLKGANSSEAVANVKAKVEQVRQTLPEGIDLYPYLDRSALVKKTIQTVSKNLLEGGLIVIVVLVLLLGNFRAGLIVASVIPLSMLFALICMNWFGVSANLMSLGAIDFGIVVDGAVIIVESILYALHTQFPKLAGGRGYITRAQLENLVETSTARIYQSAAFGVLIILLVFVPVLTLEGIEGKMFQPMALTVGFAILGSLLLSVTYVPMLAALVLPRTADIHSTFADRLMLGLQNVYRPMLKSALGRPGLTLALALALLLGSAAVFSRMGAEFIPTLEEGNLAMQITLQPGSALSESIRTTTEAERILLEHFPEVQHVVSKIGTAEVPTDPMAIEDADVMIILKEKEEWTSARTREELADKIKEKLAVLAGASVEMSQPIQLRFNELMTGSKADIAVQIFGEDVSRLKSLADEAAGYIEGIPGAGDIKVEQTEGLQQLVVHYDRAQVALLGLSIDDLNSTVRAAMGGEKAGVVFEGERQFALVVRLDEKNRRNLDLGRLYVNRPDGPAVPLSAVARLEQVQGPALISREDAHRRINIGINVRGRDVASLVADIQNTLAARLKLPPGYVINYGGQFENLEHAKDRLALAVPAALALILLLLYMAFGNVRHALLVFAAVPFSAIGGVLALLVRGMPFSISAGVGFIALFGVAVLNGIVLVSFFNQLRAQSDHRPHEDEDAEARFKRRLRDLAHSVESGALLRLRPVIMTASVAALGFVPMAISTGNGAEVQKPLATVVIGGLITSTLLTLLVLPLMYYLVEKRYVRLRPEAALLLLLLLPLAPQAQPVGTPLRFEQAAERMLAGHPELQNLELQQSAEALGMREARELPPLEFNYQGGQINFAGVDNLLELRQSFGNPFTWTKRREAANSAAVAAASSRAVLERRLRWQLSDQWNTWLYRRRVLSLRAGIVLQWQEADTRAENRWKRGETDRAEYELAHLQYLTAQQARNQAEAEEREAWQALRALSFLPDSNYTAADTFVRLAPPLARTWTWEQPNVFTQPYSWRGAALASERQALERQRLPGLAAGLFGQSLEGRWLFGGWQVGLELPLWTKALQARVERKGLEVRQVENEQRLALHQLQTEEAHWNTQWTLLDGQLRQLEANLLPSARTLSRLAQLQYENGQLPLLAYAQTRQACLEPELQYLETLYRHNAAVLRLKFLRD